MQINEGFGIGYIPEVAERIRAQKYADIMMDWTFKFVFGPKGKYKEGLISLLNAIIPDVKIRSIEYLPTEIQGEVSVQKDSVLDLRCVSDDGSQFAVEIQNYKEDSFFERCIAYACKLFLEQNRKGGRYGKMPVYVVAILSGKASESLPMYSHLKDQVIYDHTIIEKISGIFAPRTISVIFADAGKFRKEIGECSDDIDRWMFILKHSNRIREFSNSFQSEVFRRVLQVLEISRFSQEEFNMYYQEERIKEIRQAQDETLRKDSFAEGKAEGRAEGKAEGRVEGRAEGEALKAREMARKLLTKGMPVSDIAEVTGLSPDDIQAL